MRTQLNIVTSNEMKFRQHLLGWGDDFDIKQIDLDLMEIQGSPQEIVAHKVKQAWEVLHVPLVVDDGSLEIEALGGFPGPYIKDLLKAIGATKIAQMFIGSRVKAICSLGFAKNNEGIIIVNGVLEGTIVEPVIRDEKHFNSFFRPDGADKTLQEMSFEEIMQFSHRAKAIEALKVKVFSK